MTTPNKQKAHEVLAEKLRTVNSYVEFYERVVQHLVTEVNKLVLRVPPVGMDILVDEFNHILDGIYVAGPSRSLIQRDLDSAEARLGTDFAMNKKARIDRLIVAKQIIREKKPGKNELSWKEAFDELTEALKNLIEVLIEPARFLREEIIQKLEHAEPTPRQLAGNEFRREGEVWHVVFKGKSASFKHGKGFFYIHHLLANPGNVFTGGDLVNICSMFQSGRRTSSTESLADHFDTGRCRNPSQTSAIEAKMDKTAKNQAHQELEKIDENLARVKDQLEKAESNNDLATMGRLQEDKAGILKQLNEAFGRGGRTRAMIDEEKRPRDAVRKAIKAALEKISEKIPELGRKFDTNLKIVRTLSYQRDSDEFWSL